MSDYMPDDEEIQSASVFMNSCSEKDLIESWIRISNEWNTVSLVHLHRSLCESGRINDLVGAITSKLNN